MLAACLGGLVFPPRAKGVRQVTNIDPGFFEPVVLIGGLPSSEKPPNQETPPINKIKVYSSVAPM